MTTQSTQKVVEVRDNRRVGSCGRGSVVLQRDGLKRCWSSYNEKEVADEEDCGDRVEREEECFMYAV